MKNVFNASLIGIGLALVVNYIYKLGYNKGYIDCSNEDLKRLSDLKDYVYSITGKKENKNEA